jgi:hypothetical protein
MQNAELSLSCAPHDPQNFAMIRISLKASKLEWVAAHAE